MAKEKTPEPNAVVLRYNKTKEYVQNVYYELKKVTWPTRQQLIGYTIVVLTTVVVFGAVLWVFDTSLSWLLSLLNDAIKGKAGALN